MAKQYRILEMVYGEGTKYETKRWYPQVMDSHTLNAKIETWSFYDDPSYKDENVWYHSKDMALLFIQKRKAEDLPIKTIVHSID